MIVRNPNITQEVKLYRLMVMSSGIKSAVRPAEVVYLSDLKAVAVYRGAH